MKKLLIASGVAVLAFATVVSAQGAAFNTNLTVGSTGPDVVALQTWLIANGFSIPAVQSGAAAKGYFGSQTAEAVKMYQASKSIPNTGFVGPLTRAALNAGGATTGGAACPAGLICTPVTQTPVQCPVGFVCTPVGGGAPVTGSSGLTGGAGDITVTERTSGTVDEAVEGEMSKVYGFEVEADGSDVALTSVRVEFKHTGATGSDRLDRYVDEVVLMQGNTVIGRADVDSFSENSDVYSRNIPVSNAVVRDNATERFYVAVEAVNNIDSTDLATNWVVGVGQIRFEDATGVVLTDTTGDGVSGNDNGPLSETFTFEDLSTSGDIRLRVSEDDQSVNEPHTVRVDDTNDTNDVEILSFTVDAEGSDITLNALFFTLTSDTSGVTEIANDFRLMMGDEEVGDLALDLDGTCSVSSGEDDAFASSSTHTTICVQFNDLDDDDVMIEEGDEATFTLVADINDVDGGFASGDAIDVTLDADNIDADDENGDAIVAGDLTGTADSDDIQFLSTGIAVATVSTNVSVETGDADSSADDKGIYEITFDVMAIEDDAYIELGAGTRGTSADPDTGVNFVIQDAPNSYAATTTGAIALSDLTRVSGGSLSGEFVKIGAGQNARFKLRVEFDPSPTDDGDFGYRMYLYSVNFAATAVNETSQQVLLPEADYRTGAITVND